MYDIKKKEIIREFKKVYEVSRLNDHTVAVRYSDETVELYDLRDSREPIKKFQNIREVFRLNDHTVAIHCVNTRYHSIIDTVELYNLEKKEIIREFKKVYEVSRLNDHTVAISWNCNVELYDIKKKEIIREFKKVYEVSRLNDHTVAVRYLDKTVKLYDLRDSREPIKKFKNIREVFRLNDHTIAIQYSGDNFEFNGDIIQCGGGNIEFYDLEIKKVIWKERSGRTFKNIQLLGKEHVVMGQKSSVRVFNWRKNKLIFEKLKNKFSGSFVFGGNKLAVKTSNHLDIFVEDSRNNEIKNIKVEHACNSSIKARGNNIWTMDNGILRRFGPDLSLKKLNAKQLLLFISAKRSGRHPIEIDNVVWESIDSELQEELFGKPPILTRLKSYLRNPYVGLSGIGIISFASYFLYLKYLSRRAA